MRIMIRRYHQITTIDHCRQNFVCVCECVCVCIYMCTYASIMIKICDKVSLTDTSSKQL